MWETLSAALLWFLEEWGEAAIFVVLLLEEAGVPLPLPADLALLWEGSRVASGRRLFVVALLVVEVATAIGASILYWLARRGGRPLLLRYGRFLHLDAGKLRRAEGWVQRNAAVTVILGRIVPGFRITTPFAAGVFRVPYLTFLPSLAAGTLVTSSFWIGMGFFFGPSALAAIETPQVVLRLALSVVLLGALLGVTWKIRRAV